MNSQPRPQDLVFSYGSSTGNRVRGVLLGILGEGVPPGSLSPDPISDQKMSFSTPVLRPGARFSKAPVTFRARNQIFKSKYKQ